MQDKFKKFKDNGTVVFGGILNSCSKKNNLEKCIILLFIIFSGGIGGSIAFIFEQWLFDPKPIDDAATAISIANTYIVFTTFFFVGVTAILSVVGYVVNQEFSVFKKSQEKEVQKEILNKIKNDEDFGEELAKAFLDNDIVSKFIIENLDKKINDLVKNKSLEREEVQDKELPEQESKTQDKVKELSSQIKKIGD